MSASIEIPQARLPVVKSALNRLVDERTSAPWASYSAEDLALDTQDREDIERIRTVADVYEWLKERGQQTAFVEWSHCLDPLQEFRVEGKEWPDENDEAAFRAYLRQTYGLAVE